MKLAIYQTDYSQIPLEVSDYVEESEKYLRISEIVEVEIPLFSEADQVAAKIKIIDNQIEEARAMLTARIEELTEQRQRLLAIEEK